MKKKLLATLLVLALAVCIFPANVFAAPAYAEGLSTASVSSTRAYPDIIAYVTLYNHTDVIVRSGPGTNYSKLATVYVGYTIPVCNWNYNNTGWAEVSWNGQKGYIRADLLS